MGGFCSHHCGYLFRDEIAVELCCYEPVGRDEDGEVQTVEVVDVKYHAPLQTFVMLHITEEILAFCAV